jgi:predicted sulfurtransferase
MPAKTKTPATPPAEPKASEPDHEREAHAEPDTSDPALRIALADLRKLLDESRAVVIDVRGEDMYDEGHIPGALEIALAEIEDHIKALAASGKTIVAYCS